MDLKRLWEIREDFLERLASSLNDEGVIFFTNGKDPLIAYLTREGKIGRHYVQTLRRPPGFAPAPYLFGLVINMTLNDNLPIGMSGSFGLSLEGFASFSGFSSGQKMKLVCTPKEMRGLVPFVVMRIMCDVYPDDPPFVLCPVRTCTPPMSEEVWTVDAFKTDEKACLLVLDEIADKDDPLA